MAYPILTPAQWAGATPFPYDPQANGYGSEFLQIGWSTMPFNGGTVTHEWDRLFVNQPYALTAPAANVVRTELHPGDQVPFDISAGTGSERCEIACSYDGSAQTPAGPGRVPVKTPVRMTYGLTVEPGPQNTARWLVLSQFHEDQVTGSPPISICLAGNSDVMTVNTGYTDPTTGSPVNGPVWTDTAPIVRGHRYQMDILARVDPDGDGYLIVNRDGVRLVTLHNVRIGYQGQTNSFWKIGVYRHGPGKEILAAHYDNMAFTWPVNPMFP